MTLTDMKLHPDTFSIGVLQVGQFFHPVLDISRANSSLPSQEWVGFSGDTVNSCWQSLHQEKLQDGSGHCKIFVL